MEQDQYLTDVRQRVAAGEARAMHELAMALYKSAPRENLDEAAYWLMRSAQEGYPIAQYVVGKWYANGVYTQANPKEASRWIARATESSQVVELVQCEAANEDVDALCTLGTLHFHGKGVEQSWQKAFQCYTRAAELGAPRAMCNLARCYEGGNGCEVDLAQALHWYNRSAHRGVGPAAERVGAWYLFGHHGLAIDYHKARLYLRMAAAFGEPAGLQYMQVYGLTAERVN